MKRAFLVFDFLLCVSFILSERGEAKTRRVEYIGGPLVGPPYSQIKYSASKSETDKTRTPPKVHEHSEARSYESRLFSFRLYLSLFFPGYTPGEGLVFCKEDEIWIPKKGTLKRGASTFQYGTRDSWVRQLSYSLAENGDLSLNFTSSSRSESRGHYSDSRFGRNDENWSIIVNLNTSAVGRASYVDSGEVISDSWMELTREVEKYELSSLAPRMVEYIGGSYDLPKPLPECYQEPTAIGTTQFLDPVQFNYGTAIDAVKHINAANAIGVATDGVSLGLVAIDLQDTQKPVTFTIEGAAGDERGLLFPYRAAYQNGQIQARRAQGKTQLTVQPAKFLKVNGVTYAFAWYLAPRTNASTLSEKNVAIKITQAGTEVDSLLVMLYAPPVVTLHGIWGKGEVWQDFSEYLVARPYPVKKIIPCDYSHFFGASAFDAERPLGGAAGAVEECITRGLQETRGDKIIVTQVDVVAHSMGGLLARHYAADRLASGQYKKKENYHQGTINHLITVATPHLGTELMSWIYPNKGAFPDLDKLPVCPLFRRDVRARLICEAITVLGENFTLADYFSLFGRSISGGARSLQRSSENINRLNARVNVPYFALRAIAPEVSGIEILMDLGFWLFTSEQASAPTIDGLLGADHDTAVPRDSQLYGADEEIGVNNVIHGGPDLCFETVCLQEPPVTRSKTAFDLIACILANDWQNNCSTTTTTLPSTIEDLTGTPLTQPQATVNQSTTSSWDIDLSGRTEVSADLVQFAPVSGGTLKAAQGQTVTVTATGGKVIERVIFLAGLSFSDVTKGPFKATLSLRDVQKLDVYTLILFKDNTYAYASSGYSVVPPGKLVFIEAEKELTLRKPGWKAPLSPRAFYSESVKGFDISNKAKYASKSKTKKIISISKTGIVTANAPGTETVTISYDGQSTEVKVKVNPGG